MKPSLVKTSIIKTSTIKTSCLLTVLLLAQGAAQGSAQAGSFSIDIDGQTIRIAAPRTCADTSCLSISTSGKTNLADLVSKFMPKSDTADEQEAPAASRDLPKPAAPAAAVAPKAITPPDTKVTKLEDQPVAPVPAIVDPTSPLGLWSTEKKEGVVHIVACGANLCGYKFDPATKTDGVKILIDMKPVDASKWSGTIHDPVKGGTYASTLAMKGPQTLRVQGCAFGGMICGGQTWSRV